MEFTEITPWGSANSVFSVADFVFGTFVMPATFAHPPHPMRKIIAISGGHDESYYLPVTTIY